MILGWLLRFLQGYDAVSCAPVEVGTERLHGQVMQTLADAQICPWRVHHTADGALSFFVTRQDTRRLCRLPVASALMLCRRHGLPELLARYRRRVGILFGALLFFFVLFFFSRILWRVEVTGTERVPSERIVAELAELGCEAGAWLPGLDLYAVSDRLLTLDGDLAYASVVRHGTVLSVRVREREQLQQQGSRSPANLVAAKDGVVVSFAVAEGQPMVRAGQAVRAGELLVSGVVLHRGGSLSVVRAEGAVYAKTVCTATVEVPLSETVQVEAGRVISERALKIFGWDIKIFKNTGNVDIECGTITENRQLALTEGVLLPIWQTTSYTPVYREEHRSYTATEAVRLATTRAQAQVRAEMGGAAEVLAASTTVTQTAEGYRVTYTVECIMDITVGREIAMLPKE